MSEAFLFTERVIVAKSEVFLSTFSTTAANSVLVFKLLILVASIILIDNFLFSSMVNSLDALAITFTSAPGAIFNKGFCSLSYSLVPL
jgi:hypothetical protein